MYDGNSFLIDSVRIVKTPDAIPTTTEGENQLQLPLCYCIGFYFVHMFVLTPDLTGQQPKAF